MMPDQRVRLTSFTRSSRAAHSIYPAQTAHKPRTGNHPGVPRPRIRPATVRELLSTAKHLRDSPETSHHSPNQGTESLFGNIER